MTLTIPPKNANRRLDKFLFAYLNNAPHSFIYKMLRKKRIKLNGARAEGSELLKAGDELRFFLSEETLESCRKARIFAPAATLGGIIFEDGNLLVVDKPAGLPTHNGKIQLLANCDQLLARVLYYLQKTGAYSGENADFTPALCNRLDTNTSGLVVCGKNLHALQAVNALFATPGAVRKEYLAIAHGAAGKIGEKKILRNFFAKDPKTKKLRIFNDGDGNEIITEFTVLDVAENHSLLSVSPLTGRFHQIRAHLAHIGHPLVGDKKYGGKPSPPAPAQLLHCRRLEIPETPLYPAGIAFEAPPPQNFAACVRELFGKDCYK